jgi:hypothetical protein
MRESPRLRQCPVTRWRLSKENLPICANSQAVDQPGTRGVIRGAVSNRRTQTCPKYRLKHSLTSRRLAPLDSSDGISDIMTVPSRPLPSVPADAQALLRQQLVASFHDERVHATFEKIFAGIPVSLRNAKPEGQSFTLWRLLVHLRLCVIDFLDASRIPGYVEPPVPEGFWPDENATADAAAWEEDLAGYHAAMREFEALLLDLATDLFSPIPGCGEGTILRQALACMDHNAYHLGQAVLLRRLLGIWSE